MKIRLVDKTIYDVTRAEITDGRLEVDMQDKTAEEIQDIFSVAANLANIEQLTDAGEVFGDLPGWTVYGGVMLNGQTKTAILTKETDTTQERIVRAESDAIAARATADTADATAVAADKKATETMMNLQMAIAELSMLIAAMVPEVPQEGGTENV